jgi:N-methylhydantoinase A
VHGVTLTPALVVETYAALREQGRDWLASQAGFIEPLFEHSADVRYVGQSFDVNTMVAEDAALAGDLAVIAESFHAQHRRLYGHADPGAPIEVLSLRMRVRGGLPRPAAVPLAVRGTSAAPVARRQARLAGTWHDTPVFRWADLPVGWRTEGAAIVEQETATVVIPPGFTARLGHFGDLILERR